jgi:hypothetical protein
VELQTAFPAFITDWENVVMAEAAVAILVNIKRVIEEAHKS